MWLTSSFLHNHSILETTWCKAPSHNMAPWHPDLRISVVGQCLVADDYSKLLMDCPTLLPFLSGIWRTQNILSVTDMNMNVVFYSSKSASCWVSLCFLYRPLKHNNFQANRHSTEWDVRAGNKYQTGKSKSLSILQPVLCITTIPHERKTKLEQEVKHHLKLQYVKRARLQPVFNLNFTILHYYILYYIEITMVPKHNRTVFTYQHPSII
jgi:hypothetical protein